MKATGKLYEIGILEGTGARGIRLNASGETVEVTGLTTDECRSLAKSLGEIVTVTVEPAQESRGEDDDRTPPGQSEGSDE